MDYTPISARRVLLGFSLTAFIALVPLLFLLLKSNPLPVQFLADADGGHGRLVLGTGSVIVTMMLVGLIALTVTAASRVVRRPSRA
ncbi:hypothetical protein [Aeromicrobium sp.]|uniref:hypothetical protein n=1 Tax=Aeromicrobium sp. TaxID=1871063 RepID=UPI00198753D2|nr:hypothetical protein [Aeromicrobium sp.]MBC7631292.1 hypothetical protein [Aeromicrobium sp.]